MNMERFPIRTRAAAVALVGLIAMALTTAGLDAAQVDAWAQVALNAVEFLVLVGVLTASAERQVTPVKAPRDNAGNPLVVNTQEPVPGPGAIPAEMLAEEVRFVEDYRQDR